VNKTASSTDSLLELGILPESEARLAARLERRATTHRAFVTELYRRGTITRLQAVQIARGRAHHLTVGPYSLQERLGSGGMGRVFLARHRTLGRLAAVKLVRFERRKCPETRARFLREVELIGRLNHENVVHALDAGVAHRGYWLAMEYVQGPDLGRVLKSQGSLGIGRACEYARQVALGLQHIHERGMIHRDVKPANIALSTNGRSVKVLDVGLARSQCTDAGLSQAKRIIGTPDYASPEQMLDSRRANPQADLYALGCTLYHLLAGSVPFPGGTVMDKALRHLRETPPPIEQLRPNLPEGLGAVVRKLMARRRTDRYRTAAEAANALAPFVATFDASEAIPFDDSTATFPVTSDLPTLNELTDV